jgi:serine/threonine-protein kinase
MESLGHYRILERIGSGGIGDVYRARDTKHGRAVAIKVANPALASDPERRQQFVNSARASAMLSHPNIAAVYEVGEDQGALYVAMEFVPGEALKSVIAGRPLNPRTAADIATQIADALADGHAEGITHGDLSPHTIVITPKGSVKILDFGLSAFTAGGAARLRTAIAAASATPLVGNRAAAVVPYLSPEQARGDGIDFRSDLFSLGTLLFEMLTGKPAYAGANVPAIAQSIAASAAPPVCSVNRAVPAEFEPLVAKAMALRPDDRYQSAATLAAELRGIVAILDTRSGDQEPPSLVPVNASRRPMLVWLIVLLAAASVAVLVWLASGV